MPFEADDAPQTTPDTDHEPLAPLDLSWLHESPSYEPVSLELADYKSDELPEGLLPFWGDAGPISFCLAEIAVDPEGFVRRWVERPASGRFHLVEGRVWHRLPLDVGVKNVDYGPVEAHVRVAGSVARRCLRGLFGAAKALRPLPGGVRVGGAEWRFGTPPGGGDGQACVDTPARLGELGDYWSDLARFWHALPLIPTARGARVALSILRPILHEQDLREMAASPNEAIRIAAESITPGLETPGDPCLSWRYNDFFPPYRFVELKWLSMIGKVDQSPEEFRAEEHRRWAAARLLKRMQDHRNRVSADDVREIVDAVHSPAGEPPDLSALLRLVPDPRARVLALECLAEDLSIRDKDVLSALVASNPNAREAAAVLFWESRRLRLFSWAARERERDEEDLFMREGGARLRSVLSAKDEAEALAAVSGERQKAFLQTLLAQGDAETRRAAFEQLAKTRQAPAP